MTPMLDTQDSELTGPIGPTGWMSAAPCSGKSELFFAPFAERPEARVRREAKARGICQGCEAMDESNDDTSTADSSSGH